MKQYEPIGKYIHLADARNSDLSVTNLVGLTIEKRYIPSVANVIGTDLSKYKVIKQGQFACSLMQVSRDGKMPVAMYKGEPAIMSPAYPIFEVNDVNELMPEYLHMYLSRPEFDREAVFHAVGGVRGSLDWEDFISLKMPVPHIDEQRKIVREYQTVEQRIKNNNRLIEALEDTAQAIYQHTFVENIDPKNLPEGWRNYTVSEFFPVITGKKDANIATDDGKYLFFTCSQEPSKTDVYSFDGDAILLAGNGDFNVKYYKGKFEAYQRTYVLIPQEKCMLGLLYNVIRYEISKIAKEAKGSVIQFLTKGMVENIKFLAPIELSKTKSISQFNCICDTITALLNENKLLDNINK